MNYQQLILFFLFTTQILLSQEKKIVNTEALNIRAEMTTESKVVGKLKKGDIIEVNNITPDWSEIKLPDGTNGYVSSEYLDYPTKKNKNSLNGNHSYIYIFLFIGILLLFVFNNSFNSFVRNFLSEFMVGFRKGNQNSTRTQRTQSNNNTIRKSITYRFKIKGNGTAGGFKYIDGMFADILVKGSNINSSPFNNQIEKLFVQEIARKYNIEPKYHSGIKIMFKRSSLDVETY